MKIICLSDIHGRHRKIKNIPDGDVLVFAGDITSHGTISDLVRFNKWLNKWPHKNKLVVAGNHDWCFAREKNLSKEILTNATYLEDSEIIIDDIKFYGSPWQPEFCNWAFNLRRDKLKDVWDLIPDDTNVLITHGPPYSILDLVLNVRSNENGEMVGCAYLAERIMALKELKLHVFGHIHCAYGEKTEKGIHYVNASICTEEYQADNEPIVIDI